jgi:ABC-type transport system substrate-binding protein
LIVGVPGNLSLGHAVAMYQSQDGPLAYPGYSNPEFDRLVDAARRAPTNEEVAVAWQGALSILERDLPTTWLYHSRGVQGKNRRVIAPVPDLRGELARVSEWTIRSSNQ